MHKHGRLPLWTELVSNNMNALKMGLMRLPALKIICENWIHKAAAIRMKFVFKQAKICPLFNLVILNMTPEPTESVWSPLGPVLRYLSRHQATPGQAPPPFTQALFS